MRTPSATLLHRRIACDPGAPRRARDELRRIALSDATRADAALVVSELVTNAVRHSGSGPDDAIDLRVSRIPGGIVISVRDAGRSDTAPQIREPSAAPGGLGLRVVDALSVRWGTERSDRRSVWAYLAS